MLGHKDAWLGHVQQLLLPVGMNGQLADHLAAQDPNDDLSELAKELGVFEDTKTQAGLARNRDYEVAMSHGWQALDKVGRHLLSPALGTGWANVRVLQLNGTASSMLQVQHEKRVTPKFGSPHNRRLPKALSVYGFSGP